MSLQEPLVSIIMPARNMAPWIADTLRSVLNQTLTDFECLVIDDGSNDATVEIVRSITDPRLRLISGEGKGVSVARNLGLNAAYGTYIAFLDADDLWISQALECMLSPMVKNEEIDFVWANFMRFQDNSKRYLPQPGTHLQYTGNAWLDMLVDNYMQFGAICLRASLAKQHDFDSTLVIGEDRDWLLRVLRNTRVGHVPHVVHYYRQRSGSSMHDPQRFIEDEQRMMALHLADSQVPVAIRRRALAGLAFHQAVLEGKQHRFFAAIGSMVRAICLDPLYINLWWRPIHKALLAILPAQYLQLPIK